MKHFSFLSIFTLLYATFCSMPYILVLFSKVSRILIDVPNKNNCLTLKLESALWPSKLS